MPIIPISQTYQNANSTTKSRPPHLKARQLAFPVQHNRKIPVSPHSSYLSIEKTRRLPFAHQPAIQILHCRFPPFVRTPAVTNAATVTTIINKTRHRPNVTLLALFAESRCSRLGPRCRVLVCCRRGEATLIPTLSAPPAAASRSSSASDGRYERAKCEMGCSAPWTSKMVGEGIGILLRARRAVAGRRIAARISEFVWSAAATRV